MILDAEHPHSLMLDESHVVAPWPVLSPFPEPYREIARDFKRCALFLTEEVMECSRRPVRVLYQSPHYTIHTDRLNRCLAFGQHLQRLAPNRQQSGQFGLYGTSAGLELLTECKEALQFRDEPKVSRRWANQFLETWNFVDLIVHDLSQVDNTNCWEQSCNVLRICHLLRAVAAASKKLALFANELRREEAECNETIVADLRNDIRNGPRSVASILHARLLAARVSSNNIPEAFRTSITTEEVTFRFACASQEVPETWRDWLFIWSSVLVAVVRAYRYNLLDEDQVGQICKITDKRRIIEVLKNRQKYGDDRFRLFGLWALNHLTPGRYRSILNADEGESETLQEEDRLPSQLTLGPTEIDWLVKEIEKTTIYLLGSEAALRDVHSPYQVVFHPQSVGERWTNDHFVVPVLPVMLDLTAQYNPEWLFRPQINQILRRWRDLSSERDRENNLKTLPFQNGNYNGTVNALYYHEAAIRIAAALEAKSGRAWYLVPLGLLQENSRLTFMAALTLVLIVATIWYFIYGNPSDKAIGLFLGACISVIANLITPPFAKWLWKNRI